MNSTSASKTDEPLTSASLIHPRALISPTAKIGLGVQISADVIVDDNVVIGDGCIIHPRVHLYPKTQLMSHCEVYDGAVIGAPPQDLKYAGQTAGVLINSNSIIREYCTINASVCIDNPTYVGSQSLVMAYCHIGHDCRLESQVVLANRVQIGGHVQIGLGAVLGGGVAVQQFTQIGEYSFMGGTLKVVRDVPPWSRVIGEPLKWTGLNLVALRKAGLSRLEIRHRRELLNQMYKSETLNHFFQQLSANQLNQSDPSSTLIQWYRKVRNGVVQSL